MGTFPKRSEDHKLSFRKRSGKSGGNDDLLGGATSVDLLDQLAGGLSPGFRVSGIHGDDLRVEELHERRITNARQLQSVDVLFL